jgi:hypothetical protein
MGLQRYPRMRELTIAADCGGSNGARAAVEGRAAEARRRDGPHAARPPLSAGHLEVEQDRAPSVLLHHAELARSSAHRSSCGRGADRRHDHRGGAEVECLLDEGTYQKGIKVSDAEMAALDIAGDAFHPEWNYTIKLHRSRHM